MSEDEEDSPEPFPVDFSRAKREVRVLKRAYARLRGALKGQEPYWSNVLKEARLDHWSATKKRAMRKAAGMEKLPNRPPGRNKKK